VINTFIITYVLLIVSVPILEINAAAGSYSEVFLNDKDRVIVCNDICIVR